MAMQLGPSALSDADDEVIATINTTPLVDVMLVLMIIFLITIPVVNLSVPVQLPKERNQVRESRPDTIVISVDARGGIHWFDARVPNRAALVERLKAIAQRDPHPEVQLRGDEAADYAAVGEMVSACQLAGIRQLAFITEPAARP